MKRPLRSIAGFASEVGTQPGNLSVCPVPFPAEVQKHLTVVEPKSGSLVLQGEGIWGVGQLQQDVWVEPGPSHCL